MADSMGREMTAATRNRRQFGLKRLLILMVLAAAGIAGWQKFVYVHPAHSNGWYEKAPYTRSGSIRFEDC